MKIIGYRFSLIIVSLFLISCGLNAQNQQGGEDSDDKNVIQFSGLVVAGDSLYGIRGVHIYVPYSSRGTSSNEVGYFSLPVLKGDSLVISAVGYKNETYVIPDTVSGDYSHIFQLKVDTTVFPTVDIYPYPTELMFKHAFLNLDIERNYKKYAEENLDPRVMNKILRDMGMDASENFTYYMNEKIEKEATDHMAPTISLLDPFAWKRFIKDVKEGKYKKQEIDWEDK